MESQDRVAVLLAAYNGLAWLPDQLDSILKQTGVDVSIFLSVDLSNDGTFEWCKLESESNAALTCLPYGERFGGAAKNFFRLIRDVNFDGFDYIALADQDDLWLSEKLQLAIQTLKQNKADIYSGDVIAFWGDGRRELVKKSYHQKKYDHYFEAAGPGCTYVLNKKCMKSFKKFLQENWSNANDVARHDWLIYAYCRAREYHWYIDDRPMMHYRQHESNQVGFNSGFRAYMTRLSMVRGHWYRREVKRVADLIEPFLDTGFSMERKFLIMNFCQLRRRPRDAMVLLILLLINLF